MPGGYKGETKDGEPIKCWSNEDLKKHKMRRGEIPGNRARAATTGLALSGKIYGEARRTGNERGHILEI